MFERGGENGRKGRHAMVREAGCGGPGHTGGILITGLRELAARTEGHKYRERRVKSLWGISRLARGPLIMQQPAGDQVWRVESEGRSR